jgi:hypothetical protein
MALSESLLGASPSPPGSPGSGFFELSSRASSGVDGSGRVHDRPIDPTTGLVQLPNPAIEGRAVSLAFLRAFTGQHVRGQVRLAEEATRDAIEFLTGEIAKTQRQLNEHKQTMRQQHAAGGSGGLLSPQSSAAGHEMTKQHSATLRRAGSAKGLRTRMLLKGKLKLLQRDLKERRRRPFLSTRDVHLRIIKACTDARMCRWVELPGWGDGADAKTGVPFVGDADSFVSHSWDSPWETMVDALAEHASAPGQEAKYYWVDIFAVNQHWPKKDAGGEVSCALGCRGCAAMREDLPDWQTMQERQNEAGFGRVLNFSKHVLVLMEPWHTPRPPTRVWCLFEMFRGLAEAGGKAEVALSRREQREMQQALREDWQKFEALIVGIDAREADVTVESDRHNIFGLISSSAGGFDALNDAIRTSLFEWLAACGMDLLDRVAGGVGAADDGGGGGARPLTSQELAEEVARFGYGGCRAALLREPAVSILESVHID